ncbi:MAG: ribosomal protein [Pseudomonadota bacterium]|jgi:small subunit ribosomal protein S5
MAQKQRKSEEQGNALLEKMISVNRVTKVVKGGRILAFAAFVVVGDGDGAVAIGKGKAKEVPVAVQKAMDEARRKLEKMPLNGDTIGHAVKGQHGASQVIIMPGNNGVIAGGPLRALFEVMGIRNVVAKSHGSTNPYNMVRAALDALRKLRTPSEIAAKRGKSVEEILAA